MPSGDINFCEIPRRLNSNTVQQNITARHNNYYYYIHLMDFFPDTVGKQAPER